MIPNPPIEPPHVGLTNSLHPRRVRLLKLAEPFVLGFGVIAVVLHYGLESARVALSFEPACWSMAAVFAVAGSMVLRYHWSLIRITFLRTHRPRVAILSVGVLGSLIMLFAGPSLPAWRSTPISRIQAVLDWNEFVLVALALSASVREIRRATAARSNPAVLLVASFLLLVAIGTGLLMLPRARMIDPELGGSRHSAPFTVALFTSTSATCVTGLTVVPTGSYWSPLGHTIILCLFQIGGLGIMTWGAFLGLVAGQGLGIRESATLRDLFESDGPGDARRLLLAVLTFTLAAEFVGAAGLSGLWRDLPPADRAFQSVFHSASAFCNAGFSLHDDGFNGMGHRWQVWSVLSALIVVGGIGFSVLYNVIVVLWHRAARLKRRPLFGISINNTRLTVSSSMVLITTCLLLIGGAVAYYLLESTGAHADGQTKEPVAIADAWFQSVTFRTAGFNSVDHGRLQPATKLLAIGLMFIGASPGSTGGGVRTISFALALLTVVSVLRGRDRVEVFRRTIPSILIHRALAIMAIGMGAVMLVTLLLVVFEQQPHRFLDHMFEATSAFGTVGVSTGITPVLSIPSKYLIIATMFLGRVGPLTLLLALAGRTSVGRYDYPTERVPLG